MIWGSLSGGSVTVNEDCIGSFLKLRLNCSPVIVSRKRVNHTPVGYHVKCFFRLLTTRTLHLRDVATISALNFFPR